MYRLHFDIPLGTDEEQAKKVAEKFVQFLRNSVDDTVIINYALRRDGDRGGQNYLNICPDTGRALGKKLSMVCE